MKKKILIVDDSPSWIVFHKNLISELYPDYFDIITAESARQALSIISYSSSEPFDLIISDLQMEDDYEPKLAGEWLVESIKAIPTYFRSHIVLISGMYNLEKIAASLNVECISKNILVRNKLVMKFLFEKLMPFLTKI